MNDDKMSIPYIAFEGELARAERHIKRLWIVNIILIYCRAICGEKQKDTKITLY